MIILITILSIYVFIGLAYLARKIFSVNICPICIGVSLTWIWMLLGIIFEFISSSFVLPMVILMGFSILGIANKLKNKQYKIWQAPKTSNTSRVEELKDKMKDCC
jgi:hypothetical protein